ncbi:MAG: PAS domain S-box protein [bacterium]|nr:PAS domain S-box protein [bacterium]
MNGQTALQELRERFEKDLAFRVKLLDVTADSLIIYNFDGETIYINNAGCRMLGYSREELFKLHLTDLVASGYRDFARQQIEILKTKGFAEFEITQKRRDGSEFITEIRSSIIEVDDEKLIMGFAHDITERKKMENELRESEERFRNFALLSPVGIFLTDANGHYQYVNKRWCEISGLSPLEASGEGWLKGLAPDDRERIRAAWNQFIQTDGKWIAEFRFRDQSAKVTWVHSIVTPLHDEQGKVTGFLGTNADITESKIADEKSRKAQDELQTIFDSSPAMIFYKDKNNIMVRVNKAYAEALELTPDKINGRPTAEFFPVNAEKYWHDDLQVINTGIPMLNIIEPMETKYGLRTVRTDKIPYRDEKGNVIGVIGFVLDITERKQAEEKLQRSQKQLIEVTSGIPGLVYEFRITKDEVMDLPFVSGNTRDLFKIDSDDLKKDFRLIWNMVVPEDIGSLRQSILDATRKKECWTHEFRIKMPDGTIKTLLGQSRIINCQDDGTTIFAGTLFDITEHKQIEEKLKASCAQQQKILEGMINALAVTTENRDPYTAGHQRRVADLAYHIGREMGLPEEQVQGLKLAGLIHDIGKISIPLEILNKPGQLSEAEFTLIKGHSQVGYEILKNIEFAWPIAQIVLQHHERINGSGYPAKISDRDILLESKIISVADVIEAMASDRPYRPALGIDIALSEVNQKKGQLYDRQVVDVCNKLFREKGYKFA